MNEKYVQKSKYLHTDLVTSLFTFGKTVIVDKVMCGSGFTTAFIKAPVPGEKIDLIIFPNIAAAHDKFTQIKRYQIDMPSGKEVSGRYHGSDADWVAGYERLVLFVANSFVRDRERIRQLAREGRIGRILIDEYHDTEIQSSYRKEFAQMRSLLEELQPHCAIVGVTATPNPFTPVDITITVPDEFKPKITVRMTRDTEAAIKRVASLYDQGYNQIVFTNSPALLAKIIDGREAFLIIGEKIRKDIVEKCVIKEATDKTAKLIVCSSAGYTGFDDLRDDVHFTLIDNAQFPSTRINQAQLVQALSRARKGVASAIYCRSSIYFPFPFIEKGKPGKRVPWIGDDRAYEMQEISDSVGAEVFMNKDHDRELNFFHVSYDKHRVFIKYNPYKSEVMFHTWMFYKIGFPEKFFRNRGIEVIMEINGNATGMGKIRAKTGKNARFNRIRFRKANASIIDELGLFGPNMYVEAPQLSKDSDIMKAANKNAQGYRRAALEYYDRRNYKAENYDPETDTFSGEGSWLPSESFQRGMDLILSAGNTYAPLRTPYYDPALYQELLAKVTKYFNTYYRKKHADDRDKKNEKLKELKDNPLLPLKIVLQLMTDEVNPYAPKNRLHRDYTPFIEMDMGSIRVICEFMGIKVREFDIVSAYPRIIHAIYGFPFSEDLYGSDGINKRSVVAAMNDLSMFGRKKKGEPVHLLQKQYIDGSNRPRHRTNATKNLRLLGFDPVLAIKLYNDYKLKPRNSMFTYCSWHEKQIILLFIKLLEERVKFRNVSMPRYVRRHDSVLIFGFDMDMTWVKWIKYEGVTGWFKNDE